MVVSLATFFVGNDTVFYISVISLSFFCLGGHFTLFPTVCATIFDIHIGPKVYAILCTAIGLSSVSGYLIAKFFLKYLGYHIFFGIVIVFNVISLIVASVFD